MKLTPSIVAAIAGIFPWFSLFLISKDFELFEVIICVCITIVAAPLVYFAALDQERIGKVWKEANDQREENLKHIREGLSKETKEELLERLMNMANGLNTIQIKRVADKFKETSKD